MFFILSLIALLQKFRIIISNKGSRGGKLTNYQTLFTAEGNSSFPLINKSPHKLTLTKSCLPLISRMEECASSSESDFKSQSAAESCSCQSTGLGVYVHRV